MRFESFVDGRHAFSEVYSEIQAKPKLDRALFDQTVPNRGTSTGRLLEIILRPLNRCRI